VLAINGVLGVNIYSNEIDLQGIHALRNLKFLLLAGSHKSNIDFAAFPELEEVHFSWKHSVKKLESCQRLKELHL
jgi:hypothetical protein